VDGKEPDQPARPVADAERCELDLDRSSAFAVGDQLALPSALIRRGPPDAGEVLTRHLQIGHPGCMATESLLGRPSVHPLRARAPQRHEPTGVECDDALVDLIEEPAEIGEALLVFPLLSDVACHRDRGDHAARLVEQRRTGAAVDRPGPIGLEE
jgi:hypothetical protein